MKDAPIKSITIRLDKNNVASFVDFGVAQAEDLRQLKIRIRGNRPVILPNRFYFQEGLQDRYQIARYAYFKMSDDGHYLLADLADESRNLLGQ